MEEFINEDVTLYDISLHKKGPLEDKLYLTNEWYLVNVRRGNTLMRHGG
jgi:hypothetical protein